MYSVLLVVTPFLLLRRFLQDAIGRLGRSSFEIFQVEIPIVPTLGLIVLIIGLVYFRAHLTKRLIAAGFIALLMNALAQQVVDYYFDHKFYDLQQNWHYFAYTIFALVMHRDLAPRGVRASRRILITFCCALLFSTFDEVFQLNISGRAFEMNDIAKDCWGSLMGMALIYVGTDQSSAEAGAGRRFRHATLRGYLSHPHSVLLLLIVLTFPFLWIAALLTDLSYWMLTIGLALGIFAVLFGFFHISQYRWGRYALATILLVGVLGQGYSFFKYRAEEIVYSRYGLTVYKGIPLPFFDVIIFPDGTFRPVDKKHYFSARDRAFFLRQKADIILIGSGWRGMGGRGFPEQEISQFLYNPHTKRGTQVIILETPEACRVFNRLKEEQKSVLFTLHNTC
jgi:VanZ family protein